jgi:tetratricopeptide (TPR) repeat protein
MLVVVVFFMCTAMPVFAQLSPEALSAIQRGKDSAQGQYYFSALQSFEEARKLAPNVPEIYGYLGLTESKVGGRELRAIGWYGAYLAANPKAANAAAVNTAIGKLLKSSENNVSVLMKTWENAVMSMPDSADRGPHTNGYRRDYAWADVGMWYAWYGDLDDARRIAGVIPDSQFSGSVETQIIDAQLKAGDIEGAKRTYKSIKNPVPKGAAKEKMDHALELSREGNGVTTGATIRDWLELFEGDVRPLDLDVFTDVAKALHVDSSEPREIVGQVSYVANNLGSMQRKIKRMLKVQAALRGTP